MKIALIVVAVLLALSMLGNGYQQTTMKTVPQHLAEKGLRVAEKDEVGTDDQSPSEFFVRTDEQKAKDAEAAKLKDIKDKEEAAKAATDDPWKAKAKSEGWTPPVTPEKSGKS
jgi:parvulin-like peptidyl-prolyl isomerase